MDRWDQDFVDAEVEGYVRFDHVDRGEFQFGYVHGHMTCEQTRRNGKPAFEWSWVGNDEMEPSSGRGWGVLKDEKSLAGKLFFHGGDGSAFTAVKVEGIAPKEARPMMTLHAGPDSRTAAKPPAIDLEHHRHLRVLLRHHHMSALETVSKATFRRAAKSLDILQGKDLLLESEAKLTILWDHIIYDCLNRGKTAVERYLAKLPRTDDPDEALVRQAMAEPGLSIYEVEEVHAGLGLWLRDLISDEPFFVVDEAMSRSIEEGAMLANRLLSLPNYRMPSGAGFRISPEAVEVIQQVFRPVMRLAEASAAPFAPEIRQDLAALIIGTGFAEGGTGLIEFE